MKDRVVDLGVGSQVWFEGSVWRVEELASDAVTLSTGAKVRSVATRVLATQSVVMDDGPVGPEGEELVAVTLGNLAPKDSAVLEERAGHVHALLSDDGSDTEAGRLRRRYGNEGCRAGCLGADVGALGGGLPGLGCGGAGG